MNAAVKFREAFRPFAPAILAERVSDCFECPDGRAGPVHGARLPVPTREALPRCPRSSTSTAAAGSRPSTPDDNPRYYALIEQFDELTGVPIVLNTSFNLNGEPIVCSPDDAIRTFFTCGLDVLYLGDVRVTK